MPAYPEHRAGVVEQTSPMDPQSCHTSQKLSAEHISAFPSLHRMSPGLAQYPQPARPSAASTAAILVLICLPFLPGVIAHAALHQ
jgi:hypothetical protein